MSESPGWGGLCANQGRTTTGQEGVVLPGSPGNSARISNTYPSPSPVIEGGAGTINQDSALRAGDLFSRWSEMEFGAGLLLVVADDAGFTGYSPEGVLGRFLRMFRLESMTGLALHIGILSDAGGIKKGLSVAERMAPDAVIAGLVPGLSLIHI